MKSEPILNWYAVYTTPRSEKKLNSLLCSVGYESYLPLHKTKKKWSDRIKEVEIPLFPSYLFVRCLPANLRNVLDLKGVVRIVYYCGRAAVIRDSEIEAIKTFLEIAQNRILCVMDEVEVLFGPLKGVSGRVCKIGKSHVSLEIEQLGARLCVEIENVSINVKNNM